MATLRVVDTGIGIATELAPHVFDLFAQGKRGLDRTEGGLGIGLTLAKRVVELHGGSIELRSEGEGRGSEFVVRLPTAAPSTGEATARWPQEPSVRDRAGRRVLIVEDQADMREILRLALETAGYFVDEAADGPSAVEAVRRIGPDAALVDIGLPGFDGYEVARRVRALAGQPPIILIALTGYGQPDDRRRAESAGFDVHLVKPIEVDRLDALLADCMKTLQPRS
jgi:CheY-like chemotaxis protein